MYQIDFFGYCVQTSKRERSVNSVQELGRALVDTRIRLYLGALAN